MKQQTQQKTLYSRVQNYRSKLATALQFPLQKPFCASSNHKSDRSKGEEAKAFYFCNMRKKCDLDVDV